VKPHIYSFPIYRILLIAIVIACGLVLLLLSQSRPARGAPIPASAVDFSVSGTVSDLVPGVPTPLRLGLHDPYSVSLTLLSISVTVSPTSSVPVVPANCPGTNLTLVEGSHTAPFVGSNAQATWSFSSPQPVMAANSSTSLSLLSVLLARSAGNNCQNITFPFNYTATAVVTPHGPTNLPTATPTGQPATVPTQAAPVLPQATGVLAFTGVHIGELIAGALALILAGSLIVLLARRQRRGQLR
jgi:hypothetical protein